MYNRINYKFPRVIIMHFYRLIWFHIWRRFLVSLSIRVSDSDQPVTYARQFFTNNPGHKIYSFVSAGSTRHCILIHNPMVIHMKKNFTTARHLHKKISSKKKLSHSLLLHPQVLHTPSSTSIDSIKLDHFHLGGNINKSIQPKQVDSNTNSSWNISVFPYLGLGLWLGLVLCSNHPLSHSRYISLQSTTKVTYYLYLYVLREYHHTNKCGGVLDHPCSSQVFPHSQRQGIVGYTIQYYQREIPLREYQIIFPL